MRLLPVCRAVGSFSALMVILTFFLGGSRSGGDYQEYVEPENADAVLILHSEGGPFDVLLDAKRLGRISWTQAYRVAAGEHLFQARDIPLVVEPTGREGGYEFVIGPGETPHLAIAMWHERVRSETEFESTHIRISEIYP